MIVSVLRFGIVILLLVSAHAAWAHPPPPEDIGGERIPLPSKPVPPPLPPPSTTCAMCVDAEQMLGTLGDFAPVLRAALPKLAQLGGLGLHGPTITSGQKAQIESFELSADELAAVQHVTQFVGEHGVELLGALACGNDRTPCWQSVTWGLLCKTGDRCRVQIADEMVREQEYTQACDPYVKHIPQPKRGYGAEWSMGGQTSAYPAEGRTWGFGVDAHQRLGNRLGLVGRIDRTMGRDAGRDRNGDGRDDIATGPVNRWWFLAGPSFTLTRARYSDVVRWSTLELLGGYVATTSQPGDDGFAAGADLAFQLAVARIGLRGLQGFGGAKDVRALLFHIGFITGSGPSFSFGAGCDGFREDQGEASTRWALAIDLPLSGYNFGDSPGYMAPGFGMEAAYHLRNHADALVRGDVLTYPNGDQDRVLHQTLLAGGRFDMMPPDSSGPRKGPFMSLLAGYAFGAYTHPSQAGSGPVLDVGVGLGMQDDDGATWLRLHGRIGLTPEMSDLRAIFLSLGLELRIDRRRWRDSD